jgi:hypothetical protein
VGLTEFEPKSRGRPNANNATPQKRGLQNDKLTYRQAFKPYNITSDYKVQSYQEELSKRTRLYRNKITNLHTSAGAEPIGFPARERSSDPLEHYCITGLTESQQALQHGIHGPVEHYSDFNLCCPSKAFPIPITHREFSLDKTNVIVHSKNHHLHLHLQQVTNTASISGLQNSLKKNSSKVDVVELSALQQGEFDELVLAKTRKISRSIQSAATAAPRPDFESPSMRRLGMTIRDLEHSYSKPPPRITMLYVGLPLL